MQSPTASKINNFFKKCFSYYTSSFIGFFSGATADHKGSIRRHTGKQAQSCCILKLCFKHGCSTALWISSLVLLASFYHLHILIPNIQLHDLSAWLSHWTPRAGLWGPPIATLSTCGRQYLIKSICSLLSQNSEAPSNVDLQHSNHRTICSARSLSILLTEALKSGGGMEDTMPWIIP